MNNFYDAIKLGHTTRVFEEKTVPNDVLDTGMIAPKQDKTINNFYDIVKLRHTTRDFKEQIVPDEVVERILEAGMMAPSHDHLRNWEFVVLKNKEDKERALQFVRQGVEPTLDILKKTLIDGTVQQKMYAVAMPRQYSMLMNASHVILPFFKSTQGVLKPTCVSSLNPISSIWCVIENIFLAATAEGLACSMRIPVGKEGLNVAKTLGAPENYLLPCYIGLGYPADDKVVVEQVKYNVKDKIHNGKW